MNWNDGLGCTLPYLETPKCFSSVVLVVGELNRQNQSNVFGYSDSKHQCQSNIAVITRYSLKEIKQKNYATLCSTFSSLKCLMNLASINNSDCMAPSNALLDAPTKIDGLIWLAV